MSLINNLNYRRFLDDGLINVIDERLLESALSNISGKFRDQSRALLILLYYTGARPCELLDVRADDVTKDKSYVIIQVRGAKRGLPRPIHLRFSNKLVREAYNYARALPAGMFLFHKYRGGYERHHKTKKGEIRVYIERSDRMRYHVRKWFDGVIKGSIPPYYLRHNRFSKLSMKGITIEDIRFLKGSKTLESVTPYLHLSSATAKKIARHME
jgi:integrase